MLENRTAVDLELTSMRKENILRTFRLGTGREDWGVLSTDHYLRVVSGRAIAVMLSRPYVSLPERRGRLYFIFIGRLAILHS